MKTLLQCENMGMGAGIRYWQRPPRDQVENNLEEWGLYSPGSQCKTYRLKIFRRPVYPLCEALGAPTFGMVV